MLAAFYSPKKLMCGNKKCVSYLFQFDSWVFLSKNIQDNEGYAVEEDSFTGIVLKAVSLMPGHVAHSVGHLTS